MQGLSSVQEIVALILPAIFAITVHEYAHGWVAMKLGDPTAKMLGRLTLNPIKHIDPFGTVILPIMMKLLVGIPFGWAKPVPITWENLKNPKRDMALVAVAGPAANLLMAIFWMIVMKIASILVGIVPWMAVPLLYMGWFGVLINAVLMVLNLIPLPPLDGGRVLSGLLPGPWSYRLNRLEPFGLIILIVLLITGVLGMILMPPVQWLQSGLFSVFGMLQK